MKQLYVNKHSRCIFFSEITCETLRADPNGKYKNLTCTHQKPAYNETCELECDIGYEASGDGVQTCQLDGTWSSHTQCIGESITYLY